MLYSSNWKKYRERCVCILCVCKCVYWNNCVPLWLFPTSFPPFDCHLLLSTRKVSVSYFWREMTIVTEVTWGELSVAAEVSWQELTIVTEVTWGELSVAAEVSWQELTIVAERTALFWVITQRVVVASYQPIGHICRGQESLSRNVGKKLPLFAA